MTHRQISPAVRLENASFCYEDIADESHSSAACVSSTSEDAQVLGSCVSDVSFQLCPGSCVVLCGCSGEGKSTVLRMVDGLAGSFFPGTVKGVVEVCGTSVLVRTDRERASTLGVVMQDPRSQFFMSRVFDELAFCAENLGNDPSSTGLSVQEAACVCGIDHLLENRLDSLSSGQKQRVALAAAIVCKPHVLVLDEPTSNLDMQGVRALVNILASLKRKGVAVVISEHRLQQLVSVADLYLYLHHGRITARWQADEFGLLDKATIDRYGLRGPLSEDGHVSCINAGSKETGPFRGWQVQGLDYTYPSTKRGIRALDASFAAGRVTVVVGSNGAGKTTLAKILCGMLREQGGCVMRDGIPLSRHARRMQSYFVMQDVDYQLYAGSVADEVVLGRRVDAALRARAWQALAAFGLTELADRHPASLSGGQKQRVTLAAAYCSDAQMVVLDEPTSGLDGRGVREVAAWCHTLATSGKTVVIITHDRLLASLAGDAVVKLGASTGDERKEK